LRTLIIFDTNKVRATNSGGASYGSFEFGSEFKELKSYVKDKGLSEFIDTAIPDVAVQELLQQKVEQYSEDIEDITGIRSRLSELPGVDFSRVSLPAKDFDCKEHLDPKMAEFVRSNEFTVMDIEEEEFGHILKEVMRRAIERRSPFRGSKNSPDIGFKDVMIWESILNYRNYGKYDKVIFFTADSGFDEKCAAEFESKVKKEIVITPLMESLQAEIEKDYASLIHSKEWRDFAATDYFKSYFAGELSKLDYVTVDGIERKVIHVSVVNYLDAVEESDDSEETDTPIILITSLKVTVEIDGAPRGVDFKARTYLDDSIAKGIQYTEFGAE
jgi:hypothetical protein